MNCTFLSTSLHSPPPSNTTTMTRRRFDATPDMALKASKSKLIGGINIYKHIAYFLLVRSLNIDDIKYPVQCHVMSCNLLDLNQMDIFARS